jgi:hypothetical protein
VMVCFAGDRVLLRSDVEAKRDLTLLLQAASETGGLSDRVYVQPSFAV